MRILTHICRLLVGVLFIFSGFIKANDPLGFSYKLKEYFEVFHTEFFVPFSLVLAIVICIVEIALGFMLLMGARKKLTLWLLLLMIVFFTFLTFYSAYFDVVKECGCFGDFLHLTPWQSFGKDLILLVLIIILFIGRDHINPLFGARTENILLLLFIIASTAFPLYTYSNLPVFDLRPYKVGTDLYKAIHPQIKYFYTLKDKRTGEKKEFEAWPPDWEKNYDYDTVRTEQLDKSIVPVTGFSITNEYNEDYTDEFLQKEGPKFILVEYDLKTANKAAQNRINDFAAMCRMDNIEFIGLTASDTNQIKQFKIENNIQYPIYTNADDVPLKTMIRSNPGLMLFIGPRVTAMWPYRSLPSYNEVKEKYFKK